MTDMFFSVDTEFDNEVPGLGSMLSVGVVAMHHETQETIGTFYRTLNRIPGSNPCRRTMDWWDGEPAAYVLARKDTVDPALAMKDLDAWVRKMTPAGVTPVFMAYPLATDWMYVAYYLHLFVGSNVFGYAGVDMESVAMGLLKTSLYSTMKKKNWPAEWQTPLPHTHQALDDALEQADIWRRMLRSIEPAAPPLHPTGPLPGEYIDVKLSGGWTEATAIVAPKDPPPDARPYLPTGCWAVFHMTMADGSCGTVRGYYAPDEWRYSTR